MLLVGAQFLFGQLPLVDVNDDAGHPPFRTIFSIGRNQTSGMQPLCATTGPNNTIFDVENSCCHDGGKRRLNPLAIILMKKGVEIPIL